MVPEFCQFCDCAHGFLDFDLYGLMASCKSSENWCTKAFVGADFSFEKETPKKEVILSLCALILHFSMCWSMVSRRRLRVEVRVRK